MTLEELKAADELILVATTTEVVPVIALDGVTDRFWQTRAGRPATPSGL